MSRFLAAVAVVAGASAQVPEQIHLSVTGKAGQMAVDFVAFAGAQSVVFSGPSAGPSTVPANCTQQALNGFSAFWCTAVMQPLAAATTYTYKVGSDAAGYSAAFSFNSTVASPVFAILADFGIGNDESINKLIADGKAGAFDYVIHAGDLAYNLDDQNSKTGNAYMNSLQPFSATHPYMASPGNHEAYGTQGGGAFQQFARRYQAITENAAANSASNNNFFYSFDTPLVHWIAFTVESWTMTPAQLAAGAAWIAADVAKIDRSVTPWVVAFSHKAWQMDQTTWSLFDWMTPAGVDFHFVGHWHQYTRYPPIDSRGNKVVSDFACMSADNKTYTNPKYPTLIVTGAPGDIEVNPDHCQEEWQIQNLCSGNYGYGYFQAVNATTATWSWVTVVPVKGSNNPTFSDSLTIVRTA